MAHQRPPNQKLFVIRSPPTLATSHSGALPSSPDNSVINSVGCCENTTPQLCSAFQAHAEPPAMKPPAKRSPPTPTPSPSGALPSDPHKPVMKHPPPLGTTPTKHNSHQLDRCSQLSGGVDAAGLVVPQKSSHAPGTGSHVAHWSPLSPSRYTKREHSAH